MVIIRSIHLLYKSIAVGILVSQPSSVVWFTSNVLHIYRCCIFYQVYCTASRKQDGSRRRDKTRVATITTVIG